MDYVIVMKGRKGLRIGRNTYKKDEAEERLKVLKKAGNFTGEVMPYDEAIGLCKIAK